MRAGIFTRGLMSRFDAFWMGMPALCLLLLLLPVSRATAAETVTLECAGKSVDVVLPSFGENPLFSFGRQKGNAIFGTFIGEKPASIVLVVERMNSKWSNSGDIVEPGTYAGFSRFKDALMGGIRVKGTKASARIEHEKPFGIVNSDLESVGKHRGVVGGTVLRDSCVVFCLVTLDRATEAERRGMAESVIRMKMKGDFERRDDARFGATFRMTPPEGGERIFRPLSIKSRLVVVGLRVSPAKGGETAKLEKEFDAWCEAILRENGEPEPGINSRGESIFPAAD